MFGPITPYVFMKTKYEYRKEYSKSIDELEEIVSALAEEGWEPVSFYYYPSTELGHCPIHCSWIRRKIEVAVVVK